MLHQRKTPCTQTAMPVEMRKKIDRQTLQAPSTVMRALLLSREATKDEAVEEVMDERRS